MTEPQTHSPDWSESLKSLGERLVHASVTDAGERDAQLRLFAVALASQPLIAFAVFSAVSGALPVAYVLAMAGLAAGTALAAACAVSISGNSVFAGIAGLLVLSVLCATAIAAGGGMAGPMAVLAAVPAAEAWWVRRSRGALITGAAFSASVMAAQALLGPLGTQAAPAWLVIPPLLWIATLLVRLNIAQGGHFKARQEAEEAAAQADLLPVVVLHLDRDGLVESASARARSVLGLHPGLLLGDGLFKRLHVTDRVSWLTAVADLRDGASGGEAVLRIRLPERGDAEAPAMQAFHARFARARNGDMIVFLADDSRNEDLRRQLETVRENAESGSMAKNRFLASVSHELRTPLNAIIGFADILDQELFGGFEDARQKEYVGLISRSGQHLLSVVNAILDVSKIESGTYAIHAEAFDFAEAAAMPCSIAEQQAAPKRITLVTSLAPKMDELVADRRAVQQILINLLSNAVKFTPEGGQVTLGARRAGDHFTFWVNDTGIGIAEQDLKRLGQPFMQVQNDYTRQFEGTGLGLSLVKGLVQLHGGMIAIDSAPGEGTCVSITLPATGVRNAPHRLPDAAREEERTSHAPYRKTA